MSDVHAPRPTRRPARRTASLVAVLTALLTALLTTLVAGSPAVARTAPAAEQVAPADVSAQATRYFITIPGSCDSSGSLYNGVDYRGGIRINVDYPASAPGVPDCGTLPYNESVAIGVENTINAIQDAHRRDPGGQFVVVGYSQGAHVANLALNRIADYQTSVPPRQVRAKLYADPMQPFTGIGAVLPAGAGVPFGGWISPGPGRGHFGEIPFLRYCIESDGVCDMRNPFEAPGGYFAQHNCYDEAVFWTISDDVYSNATHFWPRVNCAPPFPVVP